MDLKTFVEYVDVENNFAFLPHDGITYCNCYAKVVLAHQGVFIPSLKANDLMDWMAASGQWANYAAPIPDAPFVAVSKGDPHGHIAVGVDFKNGIYTAAGHKNYKFCTLRQTFGHIDPAIFYHIA